MERAGGTTTTRYAVTRDTRLVLDPATGKSVAERDAVPSYVREVDATGERERFDADEDGVVEATGETIRTAGRWMGATVRELAPGSSTVLRQVTQRRVDDTTMAVSIEEAGVLVDEYVTPLRQEKCFDQNSMTADACAPPSPGPSPTCGGASSACVGAQKKELLTKLTAALKKGKDCMKKAGFGSGDADGKGLTLVATGSLTLKCDTDPCAAFGSYEDGVLTVNTTRIAGDQAQLNATLFHEMLHSDPRFTHNDRLVKVAGKACKAQIMDRTYACEVMCFGPQASACSCNRCLTPDGKNPSRETCEKCKPFGACPGRREAGTDGVVRNVAQAIGAVCKTGDFCDTKAECDTACGALGPCKSIKATCDDNCN